jgi:Flp pilus assembly protein TadG
VTHSSRLRIWPRSLAAVFWREDHAAQLVEFAVALPLLVLFVVGIFDFSNAFTFKQKLTNIARDSARIAAADPANDLQSPLPASVIDAFQVVDNYLIGNNISDCGVVNTPSKAGLTWTYKGTVNCPPGGLTITINRGYYFPAVAATQPANVSCQPLAPPPTAIIGTCVSIQYAYAWRFGNVASLLGRSTVLPTTITAASVAMNEN